MAGKVREYDFNEIAKKVDELLTLVPKQNNKLVVQKMKEIVPEFKSENSVYKELDTMQIN
jgi:uncharacterized protein YpmB